MIRQARLDKGMSQQDLADKCATTKSMINKIESEPANAKIEVLRRVIEKGLGGRMELSVKL
ncbi:MAG: helix-turn-helix transcriptional regulator [Bacteroidota bacterium]